MLHQRIFVKNWKNPANSVYSLANCEWSRDLYSRRFIRYMNWHLKSIHQSDSRILQQLQSSFSCWTQPFFLLNAAIVQGALKNTIHGNLLKESRGAISNSLDLRRLRAPCDARYRASSGARESSGGRDKRENSGESVWSPFCFVMIRVAIGGV